MKVSMIKVIVIKHNEEPQVVEVCNDFRAMQGIVGGLIEYMPFDKENPACELMVNEEYLINGSEFNRYVRSDFHPYPDYSTMFGVPIMGTFAVVRHDFDEGESISLTEKDIKKYCHIFRL